MRLDESLDAVLAEVARPEPAAIERMDLRVGVESADSLCPCEGSPAGLVSEGHGRRRAQSSSLCLDTDVCHAEGAAGDVVREVAEG